MTESRRTAWRFPVTVFLSAFLLFQIQPIVARRLLPEFGGTPAVWSTCLLFFQAVLLGGYIYAHWLRWRWVHVVMLAGSFVFLAITPAKLHSTGSAGDPSLQILLLLAATVGPPYFLLSSTAPLVQRWFNADQPEKSPWRLYALSNFGSFLALLSYPFAVEPYVSLAKQTQIWTWVYGAFVVVCGWTALTVSAGELAQAEPARDEGDRPSALRILFWLALAASGSTILLATTNEISQEIAVNPFLWVAPLSLYLLTFVLTFESDRWYKPAAYAGLAGLIVAIACAVSSAANAIPVLPQLAVYLAALYFACMLCQGELVRSRPSPRYLTQFYLTVAAGGALGGVFVALIAPRVFTEFSEYPIGLGAACVLGLASWIHREGRKAWSSFDTRIPVMALALGALTAGSDAAISGGQGSVVSRRNFYGILRVTEASDSNGPKRKLTHGRIDHGFQYEDASRRDWPTSYYGPHSGVAVALNALPVPRSIAVVGLGTGTLAAWGRPGDTIRFYEINPDVVSIANTWFSFLKDSKARIAVTPGDARVQLADELDRGAAGDFDAIVVDAFSSDAIPMHLLTAECADIYRRHLKPGGILLLHITNRTLDLEPVARGMAEHLGWPAFEMVSQANPETGESVSRWVLIAAKPSALIGGGGWAPLTRPPLLWTDDFASLWHVLKF
ncbi:MAG TPA: fused MFS/spermidine synthase [Bryobacteraceae bacterium]